MHVSPSFSSTQHHTSALRLQGLELWRPLTSLVYLGPLSMSWLTNVYFLTQHGTRLEMVSGTAEQLIFLLLVVRDVLVLCPASF